MRYLLLQLSVIFLASYGHNSYGQWNIVNDSHVNPSANVLFANFNNEVSVVGKQGSNYNLISKRKATVIRLSATNFTVRPNSPGIDTIQLFEKSKLVYEKVFKVDSAPRYILTLGSIKEGPASKEEVILNKRLQVYFPNCKCPIEYYVGNFTLSFVSHNLASHEKYLTIIGNTLNEKAIEAIRKLSSRDQIVFENIRLQDVSSIARQVDKFVITIK